MKVGIYIRVSTREQAQEGYSIGEQQERLTKYVEAKNWTLTKIYTDPGFSGAKLDRPALQQLIKDCNKKRLDMVLVYKLDRLSRSQKDTLYLIEEVFEKNNIHFSSMSENFDTSTAFGRAMIGILSVFAQLEREQIKERMEMGHVARAKEGYFHGGGFAPIGYDYVNGELKINEYEALQVKKIYEMFLNGETLNHITTVMHDNYKHKYGNWHSVTSVVSCLTTPIYCGKIQYEGEIYEGKHKGIVSEKTFNKVQEMLKERSKNVKVYQKTPFKYTYLLSGLLWCKNCGARYYVKRNTYKNKHGEKIKGLAYYTCYSRGKTNKRMIINPNCKNKTWNVKKLDEIIKNEILKLSFDFDEYIKTIAANEPDEEININNEETVLKNRLEEINKQINKLIDLYQLDTLPIDILNKKVNTLNEEKTNIENELNNISAAPRENKNDIKELLKDINVKNVFENGTIQKQRNLVNSLIDKILIDNDNIIIEWSFI